MDGFLGWQKKFRIGFEKVLDLNMNVFHLGLAKK